MSGIATAIIGSAVVSGYASSQASDDASAAQVGAADAGIAEQSRQFDAIQELLSPYVGSGTDAVQQLNQLLGLGGDDAQRDAIAQLEESPEFQALIQQGEEGILQNASATGGLRGGNVQKALAQYRPQVLSELIDKQFGRLSSVADRGQASAVGQATAGINTSNVITNLLTDQGRAVAGNEIAQGQVMSDIGNAIGTAGIIKASGVF